MTNQEKPSKALNISLWVAQGLLAAGLLWGSAMKLFLPIEKLATMWPWAGQVPLALVKTTAIIDLLGALGIILPALLNIKPKLTAVAALGIMMLMICASVFHISRGETSQIGINIFFFFLAAFVAWGIRKKGI